MAISSLNPHAPLFVPAAFLAAEDFSPDWWRLVHTCPAFREFWIKERSDSYQDPELPSDLDLDLDLGLDFDLDFELDSDLDGSLLSDDDEFEDPTSPLVNPALHDCSYSLPVLKQEENIPPAPLLPRALNVDVHAFAAKADLRELAISKQRKQQYSPPSSREKVPQIVTAHYMKSSPRKIQQPR